MDPKQGAVIGPDPTEMCVCVNRVVNEDFKFSRFFLRPDSDHYCLLDQ